MVTCLVSRWVYENKDRIKKSDSLLWIDNRLWLAHTNDHVVFFAHGGQYGRAQREIEGAVLGCK